MRWGETLVDTHRMSCPALLIVTCLPGSGINVRLQDLPILCLFSLSPFLTFPSVLSKIFQFSSFQAPDQPAKLFTTASLYMLSPGHICISICQEHVLSLLSPPTIHVGTVTQHSLFSANDDMSH